MTRQVSKHLAQHNYALAVSAPPVFNHLSTVTRVLLFAIKINDLGSQIDLFIDMRKYYAQKQGTTTTKNR